MEKALYKCTTLTCSEAPRANESIHTMYSEARLSERRIVINRDVSTGSEVQKETVRSLILSGIEIHASITDYFHNLASFGADSRKRFARMHDFVRSTTQSVSVNDLDSSQNKAK